MKNSDELHILHLPSWYLPEGGQFCRNQVQALNANGIKTNILANVTIALRKYGLKKMFSFPKSTFMSHEDNIHVFRHYHISLPLLKKLDGILWSHQTLYLFKKYCKIYGKPDVIHVHSVLWGGYAAYLIKKHTDIPYLITEHKGIFGFSCQYAKEQFMPWQTPFMEKAFSNASMIIPVSENLIPKIKTFLKNDVPICVISNIVDTSFFYYKERNTAKTEIKAVMVNGFSYSKAYDILLPAIDIVLERIKNLELTIVGEDFYGEKFDEIWGKVIHKDRIIFSGELDKYGVREALWDADFYIISSRVESQSVSTLEALSTGLAVVCTEVIPIQIANETNAIRVPVENIQELANGIIQMVGMYAKYDRREIAENLRKKADQQVIASKITEAYQQVLRSEITTNQNAR